MSGFYDLKQIRCKTCGEPLDLNGASGGVIKCSVCESSFTLPKAEASQKVLSFLNQGEHDLDTGRFEEAYEAYSKAAELDKTEPEAYWGMALAESKIQYLKDEVNNRLQPICHEINDDKFADGVNFCKAVRYATNAQREEYERKGEEIDRIKAEFFKLKKRGLKYDCFICAKVTDENGGRTEDSEFAGRVYRLLKKRAYEPFYSEAVLSGVTGADYEAHILYALSTAETMLVVCFDESYLRTKWVKNEYTRFLKLVNDEEKESDSITVVYSGKPVEKLPGKNGKIQGIDANEDDWSERVLSFVQSHTPEAKRLREESAVSSSSDNQAMSSKIAELEEMLRTQQSALNKKNEYIIDDCVIVDGVVVSYKGEATRVVIPEGVKEIGERAFKDSKVENIIIPSGVTKIGREAFSNSKLSQVILPDSLSIIGEEAFGYCIGLVDIAIPASVKILERNMFYNCINLKYVKLSEGLKEINFFAFGGCSKIMRVIIPNSVLKLDKFVFYRCDNLSILCRAEKQPKEWEKGWDRKSDKLVGGKLNVVWGYKGE